MKKTQIKKLHIEKFRALNNVEIEFGDSITVLCGKNGTSKSSILGIVAQIFSFEKDYSSGESLSFRQITGGSFKSQYSEHFRISDMYDQPGSMIVNIQLHDGYTDQDATGKLELTKRSNSPRPVVRNNSTVKKANNTSRNFTHPVIFLSLKRLYPIADRVYRASDFDYLNEHKKEFISLTNELLNRQSTFATGTVGTINSAVAHGSNYDQESVSAGEDNAGQIVLALMSFQKLKEEYNDYKGGLLLIDEADAALFPTAQINLLKILERECRELNLQVIMTSHSPTMIEYAYEKSQLYRKKYKTIYLSNTFGSIQVMQDWSWSRISADLHTRIVEVIESEKLPKINVYFEDREAADFFDALMFRQGIKKFIAPLRDITLGCTNYLHLVNKGISEFSEKSIICLDGDVELNSRDNNKKIKTVVLLPGKLSPDQLIFEHLYNLPASDSFWLNEFYFTRDVFTNSIADEVIRHFSIKGDQVNISDVVTSYAEVNNKDEKKKAREVFKNFYKKDAFQRILKTNNSSSNPWMHWVTENLKASNEFLQKFEDILRSLMTKVYGVDANKLSAVKVKLK